MPAAPNVNQVVLVGQLTRDQELRELPDGKGLEHTRASGAAGACDCQLCADPLVGVRLGEQPRVVLQARVRRMSELIGDLDHVASFVDEQAREAAAQVARPNRGV